MDEVVAMNLPSSILARGKAVNLVCGNPAPNNVPVMLADSNHAWFRVGNSPVNTKPEYLEHSSDLKIGLSTANDRQSVSWNDVDLPVRIWIGPREGPSNRMRLHSQTNWEQTHLVSPLDSIVPRQYAQVNPRRSGVLVVWLLLPGLSRPIATPHVTNQEATEHSRKKPRVACKNTWARVEALQRNQAFIHREAPGHQRRAIEVNLGAALCGAMKRKDETFSARRTHSKGRYSPWFELRIP
jgi:hypothetical protein